MQKLERCCCHLRVFPCGQRLRSLGHPDPGSENLLAPKPGLESPHLTGAWPGHLLDMGLGPSPSYSSSSESRASKRTVGCQVIEHYSLRHILDGDFRGRKKCGHVLEADKLACCGMNPRGSADELGMKKRQELDHTAPEDQLWKFIIF